MVKIYNKNIDKIENLPKTIEVNGNLLFTSKITKTNLLLEGYYPIKYLSKPNSRYYTSTQKKEILNDVYTISYVPVEVDLIKLQSKMKQELIDVTKDKLDAATIKYSSAEMAGWAILEKEAVNLLQGIDINLCPMLQAEADMCSQDYIVLANEIITNADQLRQFRTYVVSTRYNLSTSVDNLTSISDCILFEATPYDVVESVTDEAGIDILDSDGNKQYETVTKYKNQIKDW